MNLPNKKTEPVKEIFKFPTLIYSPSEILSSKYAAYWPKPLFVDFDNRLKSLSVMKVPQNNIMDSYREVKNLAKMLVQDKKDGYETIVFDSAEGLFRLASTHVLHELEIDDLNENWAIGWRTLYQEIYELWILLQKSGKNIVFTSFARHEKIITSMKPKMQFYMKYTPNVTERFLKWLYERLDLIAIFFLHLISL